MECLVWFLLESCLPRGDLTLDLRARARMACAGTLEKVCVAATGVFHRWHRGLPPRFAARLYHEVALRQVLEFFGERLSAIKHLGDIPSIGARQLEECV